MSKPKQPQKKQSKKPVKSAGQYLSIATLLNQGNAFQAEGKLKAAIENYRKVLAIRPDLAEVHNNLGVVFQRQKLLDEAIECHKRAIAIKPNYTQAYQNLAMAFDAQGKFDVSTEYYQQGLALEPNCVDLHFNLGLSLKEQAKFSEAIESFQRAIALAPNLVEAYLVLGESFKKQGHLDMAIKNYRHAISLKPDYATAHLFLGLVLLLSGDYDAGWRHSEFRYDPNMKNRSAMPPNFSFPQWQGQSLVGKSIAIWPEQGFGDEIQFSRYVRVLKKEFGAVFITLLCRPALKSLFETLAEADQVLTTPESLLVQAHDYWTFPLSIPLHCKTTEATIPARIPYLYAQPARVKTLASQLKPVNAMKVGICWKGNIAHTNDRNRSPGIEPFNPLFKLTGIKFFTLQPGTRSEFITAAGAAAVDIGHEIDESSFEEAAALIMNLDLVISCDTSIAHLAGALGKPVWLVLPFDPDWRWLLQREDSPWYPNTKLFRQVQPGDWDSVFVRIENHLKKLGGIL